MLDENRPTDRRLRLRAGEWVEIRSKAEILATLDEQGRLDGLPFMPEMLAFCGQRVRVYKVAHKTCDTIKTYTNRHMPDAVHLEGLRCDGAAHGGCQARCLLFWKEAWLRRVPGRDAQTSVLQQNAASPDPSTIVNLERHTRQIDPISNAATELYSCQAVALRDSTTPLHWYDPRHYLADLRSRNVRFWVLVKYVAYAVFRAMLRRLGRDLATRPGRMKNRQTGVWISHLVNWFACGRARRFTRLLVQIEKTVVSGTTSKWSPFPEKSFPCWDRWSVWSMRKPARC